MSRHGSRRPLSRFLHQVGDLTSRPGCALVVAGMVVIFGIILAVSGFPPNWEAGFSAVAAAITLIMLFVIQHTQSRHQLALQLKLDELIRSSPIADDQLVRIEVADDAELDERARDQQTLHESLRDGDSLEIVEYPRSTGG
jgi:low affinity Fe/Cu permease